MSVPPIASLMPRPNLYSNQALSISTTNTQNLGPFTLHSTLNASNTKERFWSRFRDDTPLLVRSSANFDDSNVSLFILSSNTSKTSPSSGGGGQCFSSSNGVFSDQLPYTQISPLEIHTQAIAQENVSRPATIDVDKAFATFDQAGGIRDSK